MGWKALERRRDGRGRGCRSGGGAVVGGEARVAAARLGGRSGARGVAGVCGCCLVGSPRSTGEAGAPVRLEPAKRTGRRLGPELRPRPVPSPTTLRVPPSTTDSTMPYEWDSGGRCPRLQCSEPCGPGRIAHAKPAAASAGHGPMGHLQACKAVVGGGARGAQVSHGGAAVQDCQAGVAHRGTVRAVRPALRGRGRRGATGA